MSLNKAHSLLFFVGNIEIMTLFKKVLGINVVITDPSVKTT